MIAFSISVSCPIAEVQLLKLFFFLFMILNVLDFRWQLCRFSQRYFFFWRRRSDMAVFKAIRYNQVLNFESPRNFG